MPVYSSTSSVYRSGLRYRYNALPSRAPPQLPAGKLYEFVALE